MRHGGQQGRGHGCCVQGREQLGMVLVVGVTASGLWRVSWQGLRVG